jgi:hypothetical protein
LSPIIKSRNPILHRRSAVGERRHHHSKGFDSTCTYLVGTLMNNLVMAMTKGSLFSGNQTSFQASK